MTSLKPYSKSIVAIVGAIVTGLTQVFPDSPDVSRWCAFVMSVLTVAAVYAIPNADPTGTHQAESVQPPENSAPAADYIHPDTAGFFTADPTTPPAPKPNDPDKGGYWGGV